ncbi:MAG: hypothetical protein LKI76_04490 [Megasphaera sp.]|jgi:hypothetical protein|nr:hypothetical protein [Megasphaera sp.]MCI1823180.1 hypothetical protein [Megasphaera sp.]
MSWWRDILRQCVFMCLFIIPIPIGAYTIHNGSSAVVALISYFVLYFCIPLLYLGFDEARFGRQQRFICRRSYVIMWIIAVVTLSVFSLAIEDIWKNSSFWEWPTLARDIVFIIFMYVEVSMTMLGAFILTQLRYMDMAITGGFHEK